MRAGACRRRPARLARLDRGAAPRRRRAAGLAAARRRARRRSRARTRREPLPTLMLTDLAWARAARAAARRPRSRGARPRARSSTRRTTAALLWPRPGAIRFDALGGRQPPRPPRPLAAPARAPAPARRRRCCCRGARAGCARRPTRPRAATARSCCPVPVEPSGPAARRARDIAAITYAANPRKKGLDRVLAAWRRAARRARDADGRRGAASSPARRPRSCSSAGLRRRPASRACASSARSRPSEYRALLRRARVFVCAPRREDYGIAQLEALADGCQLVTTRRARALRGAADRARARRAAGRRRPRRRRCARRSTSRCPATPSARARRSRRSRREAVDRLVAEQLLPRLLA